MENIIKRVQWKGPPFTIIIQKNDRDGKYVLTDAQQKFILKLEDMDKNDEGTENEKKVLDLLLNEPKDNLPRPLKFTKIDNTNVSIMVNNGVSLDGKTFMEYFDEMPTANDFIMAAKSLVNAVNNFHGMGFVHRDITPGNVVYNRKTNTWTLIDFDFAVPFDYEQMGSEVIVNPKYDYIIHPWFTLDKDDYMIFEVDKLKRYIGDREIPWYMLIDYYATAKVLLYNFGLLLSSDETYYYIMNDTIAFDLILQARFKNVNKKLKDLIKLLMSIVASFTESIARVRLQNAVELWESLLVMIGIKKSKKRTRNDTGEIKGRVGKLRRTRGSARTYELIK